MNVKTILISALSSLNYPIYLQGSLDPEEEYPDSFITFWTDFTNDGSHYDDNVHSVNWNFSIIFYSNNATLVNTVPDTIRTLLKAAGFTPQGKGQDILSDEPTHTGWVQEYIYTEFNL